MGPVELGFTVKAVQDKTELTEVCRLRHTAYAHHVPDLFLNCLEEEDFSSASIVLLAQSKQDGKALGTLRIKTGSSNSLVDVKLPDWLDHPQCAELSRFAIARGSNNLVRLALMKAGFLHCLAAQAKWMIIGARTSALVKIYKAIGFIDVYEGKGIKIRMPNLGTLEHSILAFNVPTAESRYRAASHSLYEFMFDTFHPDIRLFANSLEQSTVAAYDFHRLDTQVKV